MLKRIEICGGIAAGKTTLVQILAENGFSPIYENFEDNPFLSQFYQNNALDNTFETEMACVLLHYSGIKQRQGESIWVSDYALVQDYSYGMQNLKPAPKEVFDHFYGYLCETLVPANMIIYLKCSAECLLERIQERNRNMESSITKGYLQKHIEILEYNLRNEKRLCIIDSERFDFREKDKGEVLEMIRKEMARHEMHI